MICSVGFHKVSGFWPISIASGTARRTTAGEMNRSAGGCREIAEGYVKIYRTSRSIVKCQSYAIERVSVWILSRLDDNAPDTVFSEIVSDGSVERRRVLPIVERAEENFPVDCRRLRQKMKPKEFEMQYS